MFELQFVNGLFIGFELNIIHIVLSAPINAENDLELDYNAIEARSLFGKPDRSMNEADAYEEIELENIFINPDEMYFEGDIFNPDEFPEETTLWPNGVIPVEINPNFTAFQTNQTMIAIRELTVKTCLRFPMRTIEEDYVYITDEENGCFSDIGQIGGRQEVNLENPKCFDKLGVIIHELLHVVGFYHEHARNDRDDYVEIMWENIIEEYIGNFDKRTEKIDPSVDLTYDYASVMHYSRYSGAIDKTKETITPLFNTTDALIMGQRAGLSSLDIKKINLKYHCDTNHTNIKKIDGIALQFKTKDRMLDLLFNPKYMYQKSNY